ncbi:MAG TPA: c-type cytochrome [Thermoanaerobaculia bacterium]|jgi:mono/diheme cytochrome c family protein
MTRTRLLGGLVFGAIVAFGVTLYATESHPSELFKQYCAKCHGEDGKADTAKGKNLMARKFADAEWQAGVTDAQLIKSVTNGKGDDMPPFGKKLTPEQIESLVKNDVRGFKPAAQ